MIENISPRSSEKTSINIISDNNECAETSNFIYEDTGVWVTTPNKTNVHHQFSSLFPKQQTPIIEMKRYVLPRAGFVSVHAY